MIRLDLPLEEACFAVVDVETTGLGSADRVVEVACLRLHGFQELARFQSLVNPGIPIAPAASSVSGITDEMVAHAPIFPEISPGLEKLLLDAVFVAHNAPFDLHFLSRERKRWGLPPRKGPVVDTLRLARNVIDLPKYGLGALRDSLNLDHAPSHRALSDALATASLLARLIDRMDPRPRILEELLKAQEPVPVSWPECLREGLSPQVILPLQMAEERDQIAELDYQSRSGVHTHWIRPLCIERNGPLFYLQAELVDGDELRAFRISRIQSVRLPGGPAADQKKNGSSKPGASP